MAFLDLVASIALFLLFFSEQLQQSLPLVVADCRLEQFFKMLNVFATNEPVHGCLCRVTLWHLPYTTASLCQIKAVLRQVIKMKQVAGDPINFRCSDRSRSAGRCRTRDEVHALVFPCRRRGSDWIDAKTERLIEVHPSHWQEWTDAVTQNCKP